MTSMATMYVNSGLIYTALLKVTLGVRTRLEWVMWVSYKVEMPENFPSRHFETASKVCTTFMSGTLMPFGQNVEEEHMVFSSLKLHSPCKNITKLP